MLQLARQADIVMKHSGIGCDDRELEWRVPAEYSGTGMTFNWDVDSPATIHRMRADRSDALALAIPGYDGGPMARDGFKEFGARVLQHVQRT